VIFANDVEFSHIDVGNWDEDEIGFSASANDGRWQDPLQPATVALFYRKPVELVHTSSLPGERRHLSSDAAI
jgi:hypothetical protein